MRREFGAVAFTGAAFLLMTLSAGCGGSDEPLFSAVGSYGDVAVLVSDHALYETATPFLDLLSPDETFVIKTEETYRYHEYVGEDWKHGRNYRNLIYLTTRGADDDVARAARALLGDERFAHFANEGGVYIVHDPYFRNQLALVAVAPNRSRLGRTLRSLGPALSDTLDADVMRRMARDARRDGIHEATIGRDWDRYGFWLEIPQRFAENQLEPDGFPAVEWLASMPNGAANGLTIGWLACDDPAAKLADGDALKAFRRELGERLHDRSVLNEASMAWSVEAVAGLGAVRLDGAWESSRAGVGGPFRTYFIADEARGRVLCLDLLVYAPNREKMDDMRRLRAVVETFSLTPPPSMQRRE